VRVLILLNDGGLLGGHRVQARNTARALQKLGVDVTIVNANDVGAGAYDVVHLFGASNRLVRAGRQAGSAVVASPIWWSAEYRITGGRQPRLMHRLEFAARLAYSTSRRGIHLTARRLRQRFDEAALAFESADLLLPNSQREAVQIKDDLGVSTPMHVVPNAVDEQWFTPPEQPTQRAGVAYVGRIEPHKNQLGLIRELRGTGIPLVIAGPPHPHHAKYAARCRSEADGLVTFHPGGGPAQVRDIYRSAVVHVLPSWFETTGLVSLEAAASGCAVVTTNRGYVREYFGDLVAYCDPGTRGSIRSAVQTALAEGPSPDLRRRVIENYTWEQAARATVAGYELVLARR
jgi:glycosyltransferase involved in cell wall biosynthesis